MLGSVLDPNLLDLLGKTIKLTFYGYCRPPQKFPFHSCLEIHVRKYTDEEEWPSFQGHPGCIPWRSKHGYAASYAGVAIG
jgi:hypothetical protein